MIGRLLNSFDIAFRMIISFFALLGGAAKPSYGGGGGKGFAIPNINIPNPIDFKAGVLRYFEY